MSKTGHDLALWLTVPSTAVLTHANSRHGLAFVVGIRRRPNRSCCDDWNRGHPVVALKGLPMLLHYMLSRLFGAKKVTKKPPKDLVVPFDAIVD